MPLYRQFIAAAVLAVGAVALSEPASAGEWRLDPSACPDLVEDRADRRVTRGPADLREDLRDARRINCPPSAWVYVPGRWERRRARPARPPAAVVYVRPDGRHVWRRHDGAYLNLRLVIR